MADVQGLQITVGADVQTALRNLTSLTDATAELATEGVGNITAVNLALADLRKAQAEAADPGEIQVLNRAIRQLSQEATRLRSIGVEGFDEMGNRLRQVGPDANAASGGYNNLLGSVSRNRVAFVDLGRIITGQGFSLRSLASNFTLFNPLVVVAAGAVILLAQAFLKQSDAEKKAAEDAKRLQAFLLDLKTASQIDLTATGSQAGDIAKVQALAAAVQDTNRSYKERKNALEDLKETNKSYFGDLTLEAASLATLTNRVQQYSGALIAEAKVKGQVDTIAKTSEQYEVQADALQKLIAGRDKLKAGQADVIAKNQDNFNTTDVIDYENQVAKANSQVEEQSKVVKTLKDDIDSHTAALQKDILAMGDFKSTHAANIDVLEKEISALEKAKSALDALTKGQRPTFAIQEQLNAVNTKLLQDKITLALRDGAKEGLDPKIIALQISALSQELAKIGTPKKVAIGGIVDIKQEDVDRVESEIEKKFGKDIHLKITPDMELQIDQSGFNKTDKEKIKKEVEELLKQNYRLIGKLDLQGLLDKYNLETEADKLKNTLNKTLASDFSSGFANFGESIGAAIAKGQNPIQAAGKAILSSIGQLIEDIGKNLIEYGVAKTVLDSVFKAGITLPGTVAIAEGVGLELLGSLAKNVGSSYHAFASGGIVTGPTLGLVGEAGPEVIFPLDRLNRFIRNNTGGGGSTNVSGTFKMSGQDMRLVLARANKNQGLV